MTSNLARKIRLVYGVILSISIAAAGICLMAACVGIYRTGDHPFSREVVANAFRPIAVPVYLCLGLTILGFPLSWWLPGEQRKLRAGKQNALILEKLHDKTDLNRCDEPLRNAVAAQQKSRAVHRAIRSGLLVISGVIFLAYVLSGDRFLLPDINSSMVRAMGILLPCLAVTFGYAVFTAYHNSASVKKEIELMKQASASAPKMAGEKKDNTSGEEKTRAIRCVVLALAVVLLVYGFLTGGTADVLTKAINICTECVGLG